MTRHIIREYGLMGLKNEKLHRISGIIPGVMAQTGMETWEIIQGIVSATNPDVVIAIDALAARSTRKDLTGQFRSQIPESVRDPE